MVKRIIFASVPIITAAVMYKLYGSSPIKVAVGTLTLMCIPLIVINLKTPK